MFLRTIGSRFSIQRGSLLLRRVPVRCITGVQQSAIIENGDTSVVGRIVYRLQLCSRKLKFAENALTLLSLNLTITFLQNGLDSQYVGERLCNEIVCNECLELDINSVARVFIFFELYSRSIENAIDIKRRKHLRTSSLAKFRSFSSN